MNQLDVGIQSFGRWKAVLAFSKNGFLDAASIYGSIGRCAAHDLTPMEATVTFPDQKKISGKTDTRAYAGNLLTGFVDGVALVADALTKNGTTSTFGDLDLRSFESSGMPPSGRAKYEVMAAFSGSKRIDLVFMHGLVGWCLTSASATSPRAISAIDQLSDFVLMVEKISAAYVERGCVVQATQSVPQAIETTEESVTS